MNINLSVFENENLFDATHQLFSQLGITLNSNTAEPLPLEGVLGEQLKSTEIFAAIDKTYFAGLIDDSVLSAEDDEIEQISFTQAEDIISENYKGLMVFAISLKNTFQPSRTAITELTRAFNRASKSLPVAVILRYTDNIDKPSISFATCERTKYKQNWRQGEKIGKVSVLKDIYIPMPHPAQVKILSNLSLNSINTQNRKPLSTFNELYISWQSILNISALNKDFYDDIITWFDDAIEKIKLPSQSPKSEKHKDFTIRLIARLIFIWFLKELKVVSDELLIPTQPNKKDNELIKPDKNGTSYYKFVLQNLFFNALNKEQTDRAEAITRFDIYEGYFNKADKIKELVLASPFLNGGLFDENPTDFVENGKVNNAFAVPDEVLIGENGLNTLLSRYKFTIAENTPLDEEVAVDPEMLGRIFENLLAEQRADTQEAARKNAGAFYTPRPVVSYMCKNVLLRHLGIDITPQNGKAIVHKLLETTVLDPACGSGAFPMGMLEEMMSVLDIADPDGHIWFGEMMKSKDNDFLGHIADFIADKQDRYVKKLGLLRNCLFGIDLLDYAVEITKLRCWLSLIVEQKVDFSKDNYNLKPLPNLEFKFYKRNSLYRTFQGKNINDFIDAYDKNNLLKELVGLENNYFITKSDKYGTKEEIKKKIVGLLEGIVDTQITEAERMYKKALADINSLTTMKAKETEINKAQKSAKQQAEKMGELASFKEKIKDYFIERVVFPGIFSKQTTNPGFDIVIGNPPYVNTKLISQMGETDTLKEEYGYCDDLYNHFTIRGMELVKQGGYLSYITSDTFLTIQSKENMRRLFLGLQSNKKTPIQAVQNTLFGEALKQHTPTHQTAMFGAGKPVQTTLISVKEPTRTTDAKNQDTACRLIEIVNTPKAFAAMVDTAIFTLQKQVPVIDDTVVYTDLRFPDNETFGISPLEWAAVKESKNSVAGWEKILTRVMLEIQLPISATDPHQPVWTATHTCNGAEVLEDTATKIEKYQLPLSVYRQSLNYSLFAPNIWNCKVYDKVIQPAFPVLNQWWDKIESSDRIEKNRIEIQQYIAKLKPSNLTLLGIITDGGVGLQTGDNGAFIGVLKNTDVAQRIKEQRPKKLYEAIKDYPKIKKIFDELKTCNTVANCSDFLDGLNEFEIRELFDNIKESFGANVLGRGWVFRILSEKEIYPVEKMTQKEIEDGIKTKKDIYVQYDKGDRDGNRWWIPSPFFIKWNEDSVSFLKKSPAARFQNRQFYFREGFCWNNVVSDEKIKCRLKDKTLHSTEAMTFFNQTSLFDDKFLVCLMNSNLFGKIRISFLNDSPHLTTGDAKQFPLIIPTPKQLSVFNQKFDACYSIKKQQFADEITEREAQAQLQPIEQEIDTLVEELYGLNE